MPDSIDKPFVVRSHDVRLDAEYVSWMLDVRERFRSAQARSAVKVNAEQLLFNWQLGRDLVVRRAEERWGAGIVEQVSLDLKDAFPGTRGFSARSLWYMKRWYSFWADRVDDEFLQKASAEIECALTSGKAGLAHMGTPAEEPGESLQSGSAELSFPRVFSYVPWWHHVTIATRCETAEEALFYIRRTVEQGLSGEALRNSIDAGLYSHAGAAASNFSAMLPAAQAELAQEITKDTYDFGFLALPEKYDERTLEDALERNITRFLLELGRGFAYMGRQEEIVVSDRPRSIDMLFYHVRLRCYVVVELKARSFEPEFAGKLNFYVNAADRLMRAEGDSPTIGLLICRDADRTEVEWSFQGIETPMGVATYTNVQIEEMRSQLPTAEEIQRQVELTEEEFRQRKGKGEA